VKVRVGWGMCAALAIGACHAGGRPSAPAEGPAELADLLDAEHTAMLVAVDLADGPKEAAAILEGAIASPLLPDGSPQASAIRAGLATLARDAATRRARVGFDPFVAAEWTAVGLDPHLRIAIVMDDRLRDDRGPLSTYVLPVRDRDKALAWAGRMLGAAPRVTRLADCEVISVGEVAAAVGQLGRDFVAVRAQSSPEAACAGLRTLRATPAVRLSASAAFRSALADSAPDARGGYFAYQSTLQLTRLFAGPSSTPASAALGAHFAALFPAIGARATFSTGHFRVLGSEAARAALGQIVRQGAAPPWRARVPREGWSAMRAALDLAHLFDGVAALAPTGSLPPGWAAAQPARVGALLGVPWSDVVAALDGHVLAAADLAQIAARSTGPGEDPAFLLVLGVRDPARADRALTGLRATIARGERVPPQTVRIGDREGFVVGGALPLAVVRDGSQVLFGPLSAVRAACTRARGDSLDATEVARALEGEHAWAVYADLRSIMRTALARQPTTLPVPIERIPPLSAFANVDATGVRFGSDSAVPGAPPGMSNALAGAFVTGMLAATAIPAFLRYIKRSKTSEATQNVGAIYRGTVAYYEQHGRLPASVGPTPKRLPTDGTKHVPVAGEWDHPTWRAISFAIGDPHYYQYELEVAGKGKGAGFTARAMGDLDGDGIYSTFERAASIDASGNIRGAAGIYIDNELE